VTRRAVAVLLAVALTVGWLVFQAVGDVADRVDRPLGQARPGAEFVVDGVGITVDGLGRADELVSAAGAAPLPDGTAVVLVRLRIRVVGDDVEQRAVNAFVCRASVVAGDGAEWESSSRLAVATGDDASGSCLLDSEAPRTAARGSLPGLVPAGRVPGLTEVRVRVGGSAQRSYHRGPL